MELFFRQQIAYAADGADDDAGAFGLFAEAADVDFDGAFEGRGFALVEHAPDFIAGDDAASGAGEDVENVEFGGGDVEGLVGDPDAAGGGAETEAADFGEFGLAGEGVAGAAEDGGDAGGEFFGAEGFGEIVVGAGVEAEDAVLLGTAGGEHDDGNGGAAAELGEDFEAVEAGEHDVEEDEIEGVFRSAGEAGGTVVDGVEGIAGALEEFGDELTETDVIVNDQNRCALGLFLFHAAFSSTACGGEGGGGGLEFNNS